MHFGEVKNQPSIFEKHGDKAKIQPLLQIGRDASS